MSRQENKGIPFRLVDITTEEFATFKENYQPDNSEYTIELNVEFKVNKSNQLLGLFSRFTFNQDHNPVLLLESGCHFQIQPDFWEELEDDKGLIIPSGFATHLLILAVGTARGIIHAKKPGWLENLVLTTIDVSKVFGEEGIHIGITEGE